MANKNMLETRNILEGMLGGRQGFLSLDLRQSLPGSQEAFTVATTEALKRRARKNLARERSSTQRRLEATPRWKELSPEQRVHAFETRDTDLAKRISKRLGELESGQRRVTGSLDPNVKLGIFPNDIKAGLDQLQAPGVKQRLMELLSGKRSGLNPMILLDRITR